jgi:2-(1,2-epoxy-1,2-dihydrophenyl)acetyl-CoA isomerase
MAEDAYFTLPFHNIGLIPDGGINWLLERQVGAKRAFELAVDCERLPAARCLEWGLVNRVVPRGTATEISLQWATGLAARAPLAMVHTKKLLRQAASVTYAEAVRSEARAQMQCAYSQDFREGVAAFLEKRAPRFSGR